MLNRLLVLTYEGAPRSWHPTAGDAREAIQALAAEDADLIGVWAVYRDHRETRDVTGEFEDALRELRSRAVVLPTHLKLVRST